MQGSSFGNGQMAGEKHWPLGFWCRCPHISVPDFWVVWELSNILKATESNRARLRAQRYYKPSCQTSRGLGYHLSYRIYNVLYHKVGSFSRQQSIYVLIFQKSVGQFKGKAIDNALESMSTEVTDSKAVENHQGCSNRMKQAFMEI